MANRYRPSDYLYASARIRALENGLVGKEKLNRLAELPDKREILAALVADNGAGARGASGATSADELLEAMLANAIATVKEATPDDGLRLTLFLQYPYDANNVKAAEKCRVRGISAEEFLSPLGSVAPDVLLAALESGDLSPLPPHMKDAVPAARAAFRATGNPREFDLALDSAAALDIKDAVAPLPFAGELMAAKNDVTNILTYLRLCRVDGGETGKALLTSALLPAGSLAPSLFVECFDEGVEALAAALSRTPYAVLVDGDASFAVLGKRADDLLMNKAKGAKYITFGGEVVIAYLFAVDYAVKNLRILLAGKESGKTPEAIKESMRECYV